METNVLNLETVWIHHGDFLVPEHAVENGEMLDYNPAIIHGDFHCIYRKLTTLKNCPEEIYGIFCCSHNLLTNLKYIPEICMGDFDCDDNNLFTLKHCPKEIHGYFSCKNNKLSNFEFGPEKINGSLYCNNNPLISLNHGPKNIGGDIYIDDHLEIEKRLLLKGYTNYYPDLLKHCIENNIDLDEIDHWPEGFLTEEIIKSSKGICKFEL